MTVEAISVSPAWLDLRERADAAARSRELVSRLRPRLPAGRRLVIHDLGCGSGAMGRWLAPLLPGPQRWVLHDHDPDLLAIAEAGRPGSARDGPAVTVETSLSDVTRLGRDELADAALITASALLDLLTADELGGLMSACVGAGCPVLLTLSVTGRVQLTPVDPLDSRVAASFDAHQRRATPARAPARPGCRSSRSSWIPPAGAPRSSSGGARGASARPTRAWPSSGSPVGSAPRASRSPHWPPTPSSIDGAD